MGYRDYYKRIENETRRIKQDEDLSEKDKELLLNFKRDMKLQQMAESGLYSYLVYNRMMAEQLEGVNLETATEEDMKDVMMWVEQRDIAEATKQDYRKAAQQEKHYNNYSLEVEHVTVSFLFPLSNYSQINIEQTSIFLEISPVLRCSTFNDDSSIIYHRATLRPIERETSTASFKTKKRPRFNQRLL